VGRSGRTAKRVAQYREFEANDDSNFIDKEVFRATDPAGVRLTRLESIVASGK